MKNYNSKIRILVADDHKVLRRGLIDVLEEEENFEIVGEASNGAQVLLFLEEYTADIILLDVEMPIMNGNETLRNIRARYPNIKVIMFTMHHTLGYENHFMKLGASAYLAKNSDFEVISDTINKVWYNDYNSEFDKSENSTISDEHLQLALTEIEGRIVTLLCAGENNRTISATLNLSENTIKYHRKNIYSKTKTETLSELILYAYKQGLISLN